MKHATDAALEESTSRYNLSTKVLSIALTVDKVVTFTVAPYGSVNGSGSGPSIVEVTYDGVEHRALGYDITAISHPLYNSTCFTFGGTKSVARTDAGTTNMGKNFVFNSEAGCQPVEGTLVDAIEQVLQGLTYDFTKVEVDAATKAAITAVIRTKTYAAAQGSGDPTWMGEFVPAVPGTQPIPFGGKAQLATLLATI